MQGFSMFVQTVNGISERIYMDNTDAYYLSIYEKSVKLAPLIGTIAALTFTVAWIAGRFSFASLTEIICFDLVCFSYCIASFFLKKIGVVRNGKVSQKALEHAELVLVALIVLQWNLITYIFPTRSFWGYAPMFVMLAAFMFHTKAVRNAIVGVSFSIVISWLLKGDLLLPARDALFTENLILRIVALSISFGVIYILTYFAEKFTSLVKDDFGFMEKQNSELETMGRDIIDFTADLIEERDTSTGSHVKRLKAYTRILAEKVAENCPEYGMTKEYIDQLTLACVLHDVGKIGISDNILLKPGKLTEEEFEIMKMHTTIGARVVDKLPDSVGEGYKRLCREICQFHHEKYDGKGYPLGLRGDDIPISAQIVSVVDCYDALTNERSYKSALPGEVAIHMILNGECGAFSEKLKNCTSACREELLKY